MDLLQAPHTWSGVEMALWDLLGKARGEPVWRLLGYEQTYPKLPYASLLFGADRAADLDRAAEAARPRVPGREIRVGTDFGAGALAPDVEHLVAAREGLGPDGTIVVDAGPDLGRGRRAAALACRRWKRPMPLAGRTVPASAWSPYAALSGAAPKFGLPEARAPTTSTWRAT